MSKRLGPYLDMLFDETYLGQVRAALLAHWIMDVDTVLKEAWGESVKRRGEMQANKRLEEMLERSIQ
jgi:hypothetical protein